MPPNQPFQVANLQIAEPTEGHNGYTKFNPLTETLPKGWNEFNSRPLSEDMIVQHDHGIKVRDGCVLYCDIYRPANSADKVPGIVCWSPFGKKHNGIGMMKRLPWNCGIAQSDLSGLERFEGPDPAEYCPRGFAIINVDARGAGDSDGSIVIMGTQEGEDGHDVIEALASQDWCNGNIGLAGNSHLGIVQWFIAETRPPSLKAIAPWEACGDLYREQFVRGGAWDNGLFDLITRQVIRGRHGLEDFREMYRRCQTMNPYWKDKRANIKNINIPTYVAASYSTFVHTMGSVRGWLDVQTDEKWLRWDPYQEWYDLWCVDESKEELAQFFGYYLKGLKDNGWDKTPKVRMSSLKFGDAEPIYPIIEEDFPVPRTQYKQLFFSDDGILESEAPETESFATYDSEKTDPIDIVRFKHTFTSKTRLMGLPKAVVYMSCDDLDDMVVYVLIRKLDAKGNEMLNLNIPWKAAPIRNLMTSQRMSLATCYYTLVHLACSGRAIKVPPGQIVELEIGLWSMGIDFDEGESLSVQVSGQSSLIPEYKEAKGAPIEERNKGIHKVHIGGSHASRVILPFV